MLEKVKIKNSTKGQNITAVIHKPDIKTKKLAILCPGFLDSKDYEHLVKLSEALCEQGFTVVRFDPTGTWESEGNISEYLTSQYLKDIKSVLEFMIKEGNYSYILLGGHSRGGQVSLLYAVKDPRISIVLGIMPSQGGYVGKVRKKWQKNGFLISTRDVPGKIGTREFKLPYKHVTDRDKFDVLEDVKNIKVPVILIAGEIDTKVLPDNVKKIFNNANEPKKFILIKDIGHDYRHNPSEIKIVNNEIIKCLKML